MKTYINNYASRSCAGNTTELMNAIYNKQTAITIDNTFMEDTPVGLGKMQYDNFFSLLKDVVQEVLESSNLKDFSETLLIVGSSVGGMAESEKHYFKDKNYTNIDPSRHPISVITEELESKFGFCDTRAISTACTSSANAFLLAKRLMSVNAYKNILIVGADALCYTTVCGFYALSVLATQECTPFNVNREGMNVAEGIAALLLQTTATKDSIEVKGVGASSDAYHMTNPDPEANGAISCMKKALDDANVDITMIDYINAHGTGTQANDRVEALAIEKLFISAPPVSSTKAVTGHTLGAAGALEAIISCEVIKRGIVPPQTALQEAENSNINLPKEAFKKDIHIVVSNSFAFGGNNTAVVFGEVE